MSIIISGFQPQMDHQHLLESPLRITREFTKLEEHFKVFYFNQTKDALILYYKNPSKVYA